MDSQAMVILQLLVSGVIMIFAASKLAGLADAVSGKIGLSKGFVGIVLVGWATSLPELVITASSILTVGAPELAFGNLFGSNVFNLGILALLDIFSRVSVWRNGSRHMAISGICSMVILVAAAAGVFLWESKVGIYTIPGLQIGWPSLLIIVIYFVSIGVMYRIERNAPPAPEVPDEDLSKLKKMSLGNLGWLTLACCAVIVADGIWLTYVSNAAANAFGLGKSFVGVVFLATVSSLPELVGVWACLRLGYADMAIGAIFGSNIFNIGILAVGDLCYRKTAIFEGAVADYNAHMVTIGITLAMTAIALAALSFSRPADEADESAKKPASFLPAKACSLVLVLLYASAMVAFYLLTQASAGE